MSYRLSAVVPLVITSLSVVPLLPATAPAADAPTHKWGAHIDTEGKLGNDRNLGELDLFLPVSQDDNTLLFANIRGRFDDDHSQEGNFGLGIRHMLASGWNVGGYGYFDRRNSKFDNNFNQITLGAEAVSNTFEARANTYIPVGDKTQSATGTGAADFSGANISFRPGLEKSLQGFDAELGWRTPVFNLNDRKQLRLYAGGYHFYTSGVKDVTGPRARAELTFSEIPQLWAGARLSLGAEWQHDGPRGSQTFVSARLRIPLQKEARNEAKLSYLERRMTAPTVRDVDIVSQGALGAAQTITQVADGSTITLLDSATVTGATLATAVDGAGDNSVVILNGDYTGVNTLVTLRQGQKLYGSTTLSVKLPDGSTDIIKTPSASLSGAGSNGGSGPLRLIQMANDSTLEGVSLNASGSQGLGVYVDAVNNARIIGNTIVATASGNTATGILVTSNTLASRPVNTEILNNDITVQAPAAHYSNAISLTFNENTVISNNTLTVNSAAPVNQQNLILINGDTINISGKGNSGNISSCLHASGTITGSVGFTTATESDCP